MHDAPTDFQDVLKGFPAQLDREVKCDRPKEVPLA